MAACEARLEALIDASSGALSEGARRELEQHLATCAGCRTELAELRQTEELLRSTATSPTDFELSGFAVRVADRAEAFRDRSVRGLWWGFTRAMRMTLAASGAAVTASVLLFALSRQPTAPLAPMLARTSAGVTAEQAEQPLPDAVELFADESGTPNISLDSALDALSSDELDTLSVRLVTSSDSLSDSSG